MSLKTHEVLQGGLKMDRPWWYTTKLVIAVIVGTVAAIVVASLV